MTSRSDDGSCWKSEPVMMVFRQTLLPAPVEPAMSTCGIFVKSDTNDVPLTIHAAAP